MEKVYSDYPQEIIKRAIELYNTEIDGKRIYRVDSIPSILRSEYPLHDLKKLSRGTIYFWLHRYDSINYRIRREEKNA